MSVQTEIERINQNVAATYSVLNEAGATVPASANTDNLAATAAGISAVLYNKAQSLTTAQQQQARDNIGATPANHAVDDERYGMATDEMFGHVKTAWVDKLLHTGREDDGQDPDLWYDASGNLIGDEVAAEQHLRGLVPNMWHMSVFNQVSDLYFEDLEYTYALLEDVVIALKNRVTALEQEVAALKE